MPFKTTVALDVSSLGPLLRSFGSRSRFPYRKRPKIEPPTIMIAAPETNLIVLDDDSEVLLPLVLNRR